MSFARAHCINSDTAPYDVTLPDGVLPAAVDSGEGYYCIDRETPAGGSNVKPAVTVK